MTYGNGTFTEYEYDPARRWLDSVKTQNRWGQCYQNISYRFDAVGNVLGYENDCLDAASGNYKTKQAYSYDNLYQLIRVDGETTYNPHRSSVPEFSSAYSQVFEFDSDGLGNMVSKTSAETVSPRKTVGDSLNYGFEYIYDADYAHRLVSAGGRRYEYDANGNVVLEDDGGFEINGDTAVYHKITKEAEDVYSTDYGWGLFKDEDKGGGASATRYRRTYAWDEKNRLISSVDANYSTAYVYGHDGQRSSKYTHNSETLYFSRMWTLHTDSGNNVYGGQTAKNIYLGETRIVTKLNSGSDPTYQEECYKQYYYHGDHLGSASLISDYKGDEYQRIEYTPYGETWVEKTSNTGLEFLPYKFTAKELDKETGLYYYGARYLDPKYSRWISTDPALGEYIPGAPTDEEAKRHNQNLPGMDGVFNTVNANLYHYAGNNPVKYTDPDGRIAFCAVTALIGVGIGAGVAAYKSYSETGKVDGWKTLEGAVIGGAVGLGLGLVGAELATSTALSSGNAFASFSAVTGYGAATAGGTSIWTLDKFARGWEAEQRLGGMMNNFPTIDKFDKIKNTMSSIKSMDLTCKTYQTASTITRTLNGYASKLANFTSGKMGQLTFTANNATQRFLEIAIPKGATTEQMQAIQHSVEYAKSIGVQLIVHEME